MTVVLVLDRDDPLPVPEVGPRMARALGLATADVTRVLRRSRGLVSLGFDAGSARAAIRILSDAGREARAVAEAELRALPPARALRDADPLPSGLAVQELTGGGPAEIPWTRLRMAAVGLVTIRRSRGRGPIAGPADPLSGAGAVLELLAPFGPVGAAASMARARPRPPPIAPPEVTETVHVLDLLIRDPEDRLRVISSRFDYDYLGERIALTSTENFRTLVEDVSRLAPDALLTGSALSFLEDAKPGSHRFDGIDRFEDYLRWVQTWREVWG